MGGGPGGLLLRPSDIYSIRRVSVFLCPPPCRGLFIALSSPSYYVVAAVGRVPHSAHIQGRGGCDRPRGRSFLKQSLLPRVTPLRSVFGGQSQELSQWRGAGRRRIAGQRRPAPPAACGHITNCCKSWKRAHFSPLDRQRQASGYTRKPVRTAAVIRYTTSHPGRKLRGVMLGVCSAMKPLPGLP